MRKWDNVDYEFNFYWVRPSQVQPNLLINTDHKLPMGISFSPGKVMTLRLSVSPSHRNHEASAALCGGPHGLVLHQCGVGHLALQLLLHPQVGAAATFLWGSYPLGLGCQWVSIPQTWSYFWLIKDFYCCSHPVPLLLGYYLASAFCMAALFRASTADPGRLPTDPHIPHSGNVAFYSLSLCVMNTDRRSADIRFFIWQKYIIWHGQSWHGDLFCYFVSEREQWEMCSKCNMMRPKRSHHCSRCGHCVRRMDHHCPW